MNTEKPYIPHNPGDLITAADWNNLQGKIQEDIRNKVQEAIKHLTSVPSSENTHKIDNQTADELTKAILEKARQELPRRTGYRRVFRRARLKEEIEIKHDLGAYPVVDIYQLDQFSVICSEDEEKKKEDTTLFYLYHSSEKRLRATIGGGAPQVADIEIPNRKPFRVPFSEMLSLYKVSYTDTSTLDDLETEFWQEFMKEPNEEFEDDSYCHSPWFDRCCGDKRSVAELKQRGDWDELWFKVKPRKTVNFTTQAGNTAGFSLPAPLQVTQFDLNMIGIRYPPESVDLGQNAALVQELPLMIIMKV
jgi:hypothetical protein